MEKSVNNFLILLPLYKSMTWISETIQIKFKLESIPTKENEEVLFGYYVNLLT